jgi:hypothetical protein
MIALRTYDKSGYRDRTDEMQEQRKWPRKPMEANAFLYGSDGRPIGPCRVKDVSIGGALLAHSIGTELPREFVLSLSRGGQIPPSLSNSLANKRARRSPFHRDQY